MPTVDASIQRVAIVGAGGRMGREALRALDADPGFEIVAAVGRSDAGRSARDLAGPLIADLTVESDLEAAIKRAAPTVVVDLSHHSVASRHARAAIQSGASLVIGCTGLDLSELQGIDEMALAAGVGVIYAPNFAIGAVLMMRFAEMAARWIPDAEIIELHHERKEDAPSGTALHTANLIAEARTSEPTVMPAPFLKLTGARGGDSHGVHIHSVRLPGLLAHQEVIFGASGEVLTLRHDATNREVYMNGLKLCVRRVPSLRGLVQGLDKLLFDSSGAS